MGSDDMILPSDEQNALTGIGRYLSEQDPRLAAKFAIFTRLTSEEGEPPDEDLIRAIAPPTPAAPAPRGVRAFSAAARTRQRRARLQRGVPRRRSIVVVPAALLLLLIVIITISLAKGPGCARPATAREPAVAGHAVVRTCQQAGKTSTSRSSR
jgi:hypothetical protein